MLKNYFIVALRSFYKQKTYALINLTGLTIAIAVAILAMLFIRHELSYDRWLPNQENIYKVYRQWGNDGGSGWTPYPLAEVLRSEFPEVRSATWTVEVGEVLVATADKQKSLYLKGAAITDSSFLHVLPYPLKYGNAQTAMQRPSSALLSHELAETLFGSENPLGKIVVFNDDTDFMVTGVLAPYQGNAHMNVDIVLHDTTHVGEHWSGNNPATYVALHAGADVAALEQKITDNINPRIKAEVKDSWERYPDWRLQKLPAVHLNEAQVHGPFTGKGSMRTVYIIGLVALVVLAIASINYMNLATAQATRRAREVGVRKVTGATNRQLITQFLAEATLQALVALPLAMLLADLILPAFETVVNRDLILNWSVWSSLSSYLLLLVIILGALSGSYPAFFLAAYRPADVLKGQWLRKDRGRILRHGMVVTQFTGAMVAAIVMFFIYQQVQFMQNQELGFQAEQVMVIKSNTNQTYQKVEAIKQQLLQHAHIRSISATSTMPGQPESDNAFKIEGMASDQFVDIYFTDSDYAETLSLTVKEGRFLTPADTTPNTFVVNETFLKEYNIQDPIGHPIKFSWSETPGMIVGVVKDFHYHSLEYDINPLVISGAIGPMRGGWVSNVAIRIASQDIRSTIAEVEQFWQQIEPNHPIRYTFLDDDFAELYAEQERLGQTLLYATILTLLIATLGLFALASYMAEQRTKEIGVRKVLGASISQIIVLLGSDFLRLVIIAGLVAAPVSLWLAYQWLSNFAYKTDITIIPFVATMAIAILVAIVTVSSRAWRAAHVNPVESLRSE